MADVFEYAVVTTQGLALQAKVAAGGNIEFTKVKTGVGFVDPVLLQNQTDVSQPVQEFPFNLDPVFNAKEAGQVMLNVVITNDDVTTGYDCYQLGVFATDPDDGEILYAIIQGTAPLSVPASTAVTDWTAEFNIYLQYGNADTVTVLVDTAGILTQSSADIRYVKKADTWLVGVDETGPYIMKGVE